MRLRVLRNTSKRKPWKANSWPLFGNGARFVDHQAGDGGGFLVGQVPVHRAVEIADRHRPSTITEPSGCGRTPCDGDVVLVADVADDLLEDVFQRHEALTTPYSSTTSAKCVLRLQKGLRAGPASVVVSGTNQASSAMSRCSTWLDVAAGARRARAAGPWRAGRRRCCRARRARAAGAYRATRPLRARFPRRQIGVDARASWCDEP